MKIEKTVLIDDKGVSEIIGVILIFGILVLFLGILQSVFVPEWDREIETAHFNNIYDDTLYLRQVMQETAIFNLSRTILVHTSLDYPTWIFLNNPPKPGVTISTFNDKKIRISYDGNPPELYDSCTIKIKENYNYFPAPELIIEHGMIIGNIGNTNYTIDDPLMNNKTIDLYLLECSNNSISTTSSMNLHLFPVVMIDNQSVNNASIEFTTDYKELWDTYRNSAKIDKSSSFEFPNQITMVYNNATRIRIFITSIKV